MKDTHILGGNLDHCAKLVRNENDFYEKRIKDIQLELRKSNTRSGSQKNERMEITKAIHHYRASLNTSGIV